MPLFAGLGPGHGGQVGPLVIARVTQFEDKTPVIASEAKACHAVALAEAGKP
ncbi:MAG: hypothetical protein K1X83_14270 [Oligoflexia bacterium]|nr:hypothetical protein [Oligoflexia bacterium]